MPLSTVEEAGPVKAVDHVAAPEAGGCVSKCVAGEGVGSTENVDSGEGSRKVPVECVGCKRNVGTRLSCPTCLKLGLPPSIFCSQECFKSNWPTHKLLHSVVKKFIAAQTDAVASGDAPPSSDHLHGHLSIAAGFSDKDKNTWKKDIHLRRFLNYTFTGLLRPWPQTPMTRVLPPDIEKPDYHLTGVPLSEDATRGSNRVVIRTSEEIEKIRAVCLIGRKALDLAHSMVKPGVTPDEIDKAVHKLIVEEHRAYPSPLNYSGFPKSCCISVNEVICHGIPDLRPLQEGDIVNVDITAYKRGYHGDLNETFFCGAVSDEESRRLVKGAYDSMMEAIAQCKPGMMYREIGDVISNVAEKRGLSVVRAYCGHGIGTLFHTAPSIPHYRHNKAVGVMRAGHVFTIEPMLNLGHWKSYTWPDDWTAVTIDGKRSAQFEHTLVVTDTGCEILTARLPTSPPLEFEVAGGSD